MSIKNNLLAAALVIAAGNAFAQSASAPSAAAPAPAPAAAPAPAPAAKPAMAAPGGDALQGKVAWYGRKFAGRKTASGQRFDPNALTMAHRTLPFGTRVKVTNDANKRSVIVRVNDRGPTTPDRIGDVSAAAAARLRMQRAGVVDATLEVVGQAPSARKP